eukprot:CAMPEP_0185477564 /NCGR_PEP_ID=MMETSP1366-20130426/4121_1 /TAXON_ID=38817 /ORGANISM="Gephyrocapsa oceanica, Strain RCC1303" /LENGTH=128 /DNA_ID=CAMNT_0028084733 /DNA_START=44 /DNA_END=427 /DNA_ORIENTATION=-
MARLTGIRTGRLMLPVRIPGLVSSRSDADRARVRLLLLQDETRREEKQNDADVFAAAPAPRPPVCFGADVAPSLAARDGAAAASAPRSTAPQQRAVQSGHHAATASVCSRSSPRTWSTWSAIINRTCG